MGPSGRGRHEGAGAKRLCNRAGAVNLRAKKDQSQTMPDATAVKNRTPRTRLTQRLSQALQRALDHGTAGLSGPELRQRRTLNAIAALIPCSGLSYAALYLIVDAPGLWPAALAALLFTLYIVWPRLADRHPLMSRLFGTGWAIVVQGLLVWMLGTGSGLHLYFLSFPVVYIVCFGTSHPLPVIGFALLCAGLTGLSELVFPDPAPFIRATPALLQWLQISAIFLVTGFAALGAYVGFAHADSAERRSPGNMPAPKTCSIRFCPRVSPRG